MRLQTLGVDCGYEVDFERQSVFSGEGNYIRQHFSRQYVDLTRYDNIDSC